MILFNFLSLLFLITFFMNRTSEWKREGICMKIIEVKGKVFFVLFPVFFFFFSLLCWISEQRLEVTQPWLINGWLISVYLRKRDEEPQKASSLFRIKMAESREGINEDWNKSWNKWDYEQDRYRDKVRFEEELFGMSLSETRISFDP